MDGQDAPSLVVLGSSTDDDVGHNDVILVKTAKESLHRAEFGIGMGLPDLV
jgi:hypothetical protein